MIPRRLHLRNFLSYRECTVDFTSLGLAVLCGPNGHGKSALLDAMTWALWGKCRAQGDDEVIHLGEQEMLVEFDFEASGDVFHVNRKKTRGKTASLNLFQVDSDGNRTALTGGVMRETQADINRKVRLDYETFRNSAFIAQGHADEFTRKTAADRKSVLGKILGLERYQAYSDRARDTGRDRATELTAKTAAIREWAEMVKRLPEVVGRIAALAGERETAGREVSQRNDEVAGLRLAAAEYDRRERDVAESGRRLDEQRAGLAAAEQDRTARSEELERLERLIAGAGSIEAAYARYQELREVELAMADHQREAAVLQDAIQRAEMTIQRVRTRLESELAELTRRVEDSRELAGALPGLEEEHRTLGREREELAALEQHEQAAARSAADAREAAAGARAAMEMYRARAAEIKEREKQLEGAAVCPVCRAELSPADVARVQGEYAAERKALGDQYREAGDSAKANEGIAQETDAAVAAAREARKHADARLQARERDLHARAVAARAAAEGLEALESARANVAERLERGDFDPEAQEARTRAHAALRALAYDAEEHSRTRKQLEGARESEARYFALTTAQAKAGSAREMLDIARRAVSEREAAIADEDSRLAQAREALALATDVSSQLKQAEDALAVARERESQATFQLGQSENERARLLELNARLETEEDKVNNLREEVATFKDLTDAFGKNGVQAMLIDQAIPEMERIANQLLERMTEGHIQLQLATRAENKSGKVVETLDIRISDELGVRDYEMYSGGEAFRIDFALRIALSRLLAERAGAALPTLIIDEGFGTQDAEGIDRLVEALQAVSSDFRLILVVTHIDELKQRFERRIEVTKDPYRGSIARVV